MTIKSFVKSMGAIVYYTLTHPKDTTVISRRTGCVANEYASWRDYMNEQTSYPDSEYIIIGGMTE